MAGTNQFCQSLIGLGDPGGTSGRSLLHIPRGFLRLFALVARLSENSARNQLRGVERFCAEKKTTIAAAKPEAITSRQDFQSFFSFQGDLSVGI